MAWRHDRAKQAREDPIAKAFGFADALDICCIVGFSILVRRIVLMPAFNFKSQFVDDVESGKKPQTIRAERKDGRVPCKVGDIITLYTGMRTKACRKLGVGKCTGVTPVSIHEYPAGTPQLFIAGAMILNEDDFAQADGFENSAEFYKFFEDTHGLPFRGWLIEWELCND